MSYTPAQGKAIQKYIKENLEEVRFRVRKGEKANIKQEAADNSQSMTQYIVQAINDRAGRQIVTPADNADSAQPIDPMNRPSRIMR